LGFSHCALSQPPTHLHQESPAHLLTRRVTPLTRPLTWCLQAMAEVQAPDDEVEQLSAYQAPHKSTATLSAAADQPPTTGPPAAAAGAGAGQQQVPPPPPAAAAAGGGGAVDQPPGEVGINREVVHVTEGVAVGEAGLSCRRLCG
jgi:hypothetical protein